MDQPAEKSVTIQTSPSHTVTLFGTSQRLGREAYLFTRTTSSAQSPDLPERLVLKYFSDQELFDREVKAYQALAAVQGISVPIQHGLIDVSSKQSISMRDDIIGGIAIEFIDGPDLFYYFADASENQVLDGIQRCYVEMTSCGVAPADDNLRHLKAVKQEGALVVKRIDFDNAIIAARPEEMQQIADLNQVAQEGLCEDFIVFGSPYDPESIKTRSDKE